MQKTYKHIKNNYVSLRDIERNNFIKRAKERYGDRYNYDNINYVNRREPILIHCNKHNIDFNQMPSSHLSNNGCPMCYTETYSLDTEKFIKRAKEVHGDKYDYSRTVYKRSNLPVEIICPIHGVFTNIANNHLKGAGCHKCSNQIHIHRQKCPDKVLLERFLRKAKNLYGDRYDYSRVNVRESKPLFYCNIHHKEFRQERRNHLRYAGCKACAVEKQALSKDEFIRRAKLVYGEQFDYSLVNYINSYTKVKIKCKTHGIIEVIPYDHLRGKAGCPKCSASSFEQKAYNILEKYKIPYIREYKIDGFDYRYDICIPDVKVLIELHGPQHYSNTHFFNTIKDQEERDRDKAIIARANGYQIFTINCELTSNNIEPMLKQIFRSTLKYYKDGKYFKNALALSKYCNLDPSEPIKTYDIYKTAF